MTVKNYYLYKIVMNYAFLMNLKKNINTFKKMINSFFIQLTMLYLMRELFK